MLLAKGPQVMTQLFVPEKRETEENRAIRGATSSRLRNHNERAVLSLLHRQGPLSASEIAKALNVSAQTGSVLVRVLEEQKLILRQEPVKGKVGKPQVPMAISPTGAYSFGLRLGRRASDLTLVNLLGKPVGSRRIQYAYPVPDEIEAFVREGVSALREEHGSAVSDRIVGLGVAAPFDLWNWLDALGAPQSEADRWKHYNFEEALKAASGLTVYLANDVNMACTGELTFGCGRELTDFAYFYVGSFIGGALVLNGAVQHGRHGNAGAFGSIPVSGLQEGPSQLIKLASAYILERLISQRAGKAVNLRAEPRLWNAYPDLLDTWLKQTAWGISQAAIAVASVVDLSDTVIDGVMPADVRSKLVAQVEIGMSKLDQSGIYPLRMREGTLGAQAGPLGAAYHPILSELFVAGSELY